MTGDSVEARDVIIDALVARFIEFGAGPLDPNERAYAGDLAAVGLAALAEHGYSVIRTDLAIERLARHRAVRIYGDDIHWADFLDLCREELVVLRGDPQQSEADAMNEGFAAHEAALAAMEESGPDVQ